MITLMTQAVSTVTGAELKTRLGGLGLPPGWFGARMGVTMRTVVRWFDGDSVAPEVAEQLEELSALAVTQMTEMLADVAPDEDDFVTLYTFRTDGTYGDHGWPASWHRMLTFRLREHFEAQGNTVSIEYS